jgi:hypothetical protein
MKELMAWPLLSAAKADEAAKSGSACRRVLRVECIHALMATTALL